MTAGTLEVVDLETLLIDQACCELKPCAHTEPARWILVCKLRCGAAKLVGEGCRRWLEAKGVREWACWCGNSIYGPHSEIADFIPV